jgi:hypothetical protein
VSNKESPFGGFFLTHDSGKSLTCKGGSKMSHANTKKATVEIGRLVKDGLKIRITDKKGVSKVGTWRTRRRKHELAIADFLVSSMLNRITKYAQTTIIIRKKQQGGDIK